MYLFEILWYTRIPFLKLGLIAITITGRYDIHLRMYFLELGIWWYTRIPYLKLRVIGKPL